MARAVEQATPWLVLAGSGGIADVLAALLAQPHLLVPQVAEKQLKEKFPGEHFSWEDILHWTKLVEPQSPVRKGTPLPGHPSRRGWPLGAPCPFPPGRPSPF